MIYIKTKITFHALVNDNDLIGNGMIKTVSVLMIVILFSFSCGEEEFRTESGITYKILSDGSGAVPQKGEVVALHYTGMLEDGAKFDSSVDKGGPLLVMAGVGNVIRGLDEVLEKMTVGSKWMVKIPPELAYGERKTNEIPPNSTLWFEVDLLGIVDQEYVTESGIKYTIIFKGNGPVAGPGQTASVHYNVWLPGWEKLDSSYYSGTPFDVIIGETAVIEGWHQVLSIIPEGSRWKVIIPWQLAYGEEGRDIIPPKTDLTFEMTLVSIK